MNSAVLEPSLRPKLDSTNMMNGITSAEDTTYNEDWLKTSTERQEYRWLSVELRKLNNFNALSAVTKSLWRPKITQML